MSNSLDQEAVEEPVKSPGSLVAVLLGLLGTAVFSGLVVAVYEVAAGREKGDPRSTGEILVGLVGIWSGLVFTVAWCVKSRGLQWIEALGVHIRWSFDVPVGIALGLFGQYILLYVVYLPVYLFDHGIYDKLGEPATDVSSSIHGFWIVPFAVATCLAAPFFEELFFRGLVLRTFVAKWGPTFGVIGSGLLFGLYHLEPYQLLGLSVFGMSLAFLAHKTGRLGGCFIAHVAFNTATIITVFG